ncbi:MAG: MFS transporter [Candidatus Lokiarchaeota archaeon]|nr:MFS transporter [Candidatus Lokiarchaeota archaeon]MBD3200389.1 MFS transporter [Candidatus Lokiarchaeota archaeon]
MNQETEKKIVRSKKYLMYLVILLMFVEILDTYTTNFPNVIPSKVIEEFLYEFPQNIGESIFSFCVAIASLGMYFVFFNQLLADKFGRRILLATTVFGMGFFSLLLIFSSGIIQYTIYLFLLYLFFSSDIWVIYINEESPADKRGRFTNLVLIGGVTGSILLPIFRSIFITETTSNWRGMPLFSAILGIPLSIIIFFTLKETSTYEEYKIEEVSIKTNLIRNNLRTVFSSQRRKEFVSLMLITLLVGFNYIFVSLGEQYINSSPNLTEGDINIIVLAMSFAVILGYLFTGVFADKYGRKPLFYLYSVLFIISIFTVVFGSKLPLFAIIPVSIGASLANVSYWGIGVVIRLVVVEIVPTDVRGTGSGLKSLISAIGITIGLLLSGGITYFFGLEISFIVLSLFLLINIPLIYKFIKETKGVELNLIK